jgi:periplasmic divalent cation tolerance protein
LWTASGGVGRLGCSELEIVCLGWIMKDYCQVITTVGERSAADTLARSVVEARLAACAQVVGPIESTYWWQGVIETADEWQVAFKTTTVRYQALAEHIQSNHPYEVPEVLCLPVVDGSPAYLRWVDEQTRM